MAFRTYDLGQGDPRLLQSRTKHTVSHTAEVSQDDDADVHCQMSFNRFASDIPTQRMGKLVAAAENIHDFNLTQDQLLGESLLEVMDGGPADDRLRSKEHAKNADMYKKCASVGPVNSTSVFGDGCLYPIPRSDATKPSRITNRCLRSMDVVSSRSMDGRDSARQSAKPARIVNRRVEPGDMKRNCSSSEGTAQQIPSSPEFAKPTATFEGLSPWRAEEWDENLKDMPLPKWIAPAMASADMFGALRLSGFTPQPYAKFEL